MDLSHRRAMDFLGILAFTGIWFNHGRVVISLADKHRLASKSTWLTIVILLDLFPLFSRPHFVSLVAIRVTEFQFEVWVSEFHHSDPLFILTLKNYARATGTGG